MTHSFVLFQLFRGGFGFGNVKTDQLCRLSIGEKAIVFQIEIDIL